MNDHWKTIKFYLNSKFLDALIVSFMVHVWMKLPSQHSVQPCIVKVKLFSYFWQFLENNFRFVIWYLTFCVVYILMLICVQCIL